ncbi:MAG: hypothetical protein AB1847_06145 [bacterium]
MRPNVQEYISRVEQLYGRIDLWLRKQALTAQRVFIEVDEGGPERYKAPQLLIWKKRKTLVAELRPMGVWIAGAKGRIDIIGQFETKVLVYMEMMKLKASPQDTISGKEEKSSLKPLFGEIDQSGWYWIEDKHQGKARLVDAALFPELLLDVSGYELSPLTPPFSP